MDKFRLGDRSAYLVLSITIVLSLFMHRNVLNLEIQGAHAWRQCQTMWNVRNFVRHESNILNPRISKFNGGKENILRYELPLMQYAIALNQKVFGENIVVVRISLFALSAFTIIGFFFLCKQVFNDNLTALIGSYFFQFSPLFYYYSWNPFPDNLALCGAIYYLFYIVKYEESRKIFSLVFASLSLLVATLAKLPFLMFAVVSMFYFVRMIYLHKSQIKNILLYPAIQLLIVLPAFLWYAWVMPTWSGNSVMYGIFENPLPWAEYQSIIRYHLKVMFPQLILYPSVWILTIIGLISYWYHSKEKGFLLSLIFITLVYLILELNAINAVHDYYMMPFLPWLYLLITAGVHSILKFRVKWVKYILGIIVITAAVFTSKSTDPKWGMAADGFNTDVYDNRDLLQDIIPNDELCIVLNDVSTYVFSYNIDKMGHMFGNDDLPIDWIGDMIDNYGVTHMYSDSEKINSDPKLMEYVDSLILTVGTVNVYKFRARKTDVIKHLPEFLKKKHSRLNQ